MNKYLRHWLMNAALFLGFNTAVFAADSIPVVTSPETLPPAPVMAAPVSMPPPYPTEDESYYYHDEGGDKRYASGSPQINVVPKEFFPYIARAFLAGDLAYGTKTKQAVFQYNDLNNDSIWIGSKKRNHLLGMGDGEAMLPIYGNNNMFYYLDSNFKYAAANGALLSTGGGFRRIIKDHICGIYLYGDYNKTVFNHTYWVFNPGIEILTNKWDADLNLYIPVSEKQKFDNFYTAEQLGINPFTRKPYTFLYAESERIGNGIDAEVGYVFSNVDRMRAYVGAYAYQISHGRNFVGAQVGIEYPFARYFFLRIQDSADKVYNNTVSVSLGINFGGLPKDLQPVLQDRMLDPIPRHLGTLNTGAGIPSEGVLFP